MSFAFLSLRKVGWIKAGPSKIFHYDETFRSESCWEREKIYPINERSNAEENVRYLKVCNEINERLANFDPKK